MGDKWITARSSSLGEGTNEEGWFDMSDCGECSMCCKLLRVESLDKPQGKWCGHARPGKGCAIYEERPGDCRAFKCVWLMSQQRDQLGECMAPELRPDRCKVIFTMGNDGATLIAHVDPAYPGAWRSDPAATFIQRFNRASEVFLVCGDRRSILTKGQTG